MFIALKEVISDGHVNTLLFEEPNNYMILQYTVGSGGPGIMKDIDGTIIGDGTAYWWQEYCKVMEGMETK